MKSITIVLTEKDDGQTVITVIRNETPPRIAANVCQLAASQLLEEAIRAELERQVEEQDADSPTD